MAVQTTYSDNIAPGTAGMIADMQASNVISRTVEIAAGIGFGIAVAPSATEGQVVLFAGNSANGFLGITARDQSVDPENPDKFAQYDNARILRKGPIWVNVTGAVDPTDTPYVNNTTGVISASSSGGTAIPGAKFDSVTTGDGLAILYLG